MQKDMTAGSPAKAIVGFTIPVFIGNIFQQFYSMVDTIIVGKFVGTKALAAVGSVGTINFLIIGFMLGLTAGFTVLTAQRYGAGDMKNMRRTVGSAAVLSLIVTPEDIFGDAYRYIMIICGGIFATVLYNLLASVLRALGNSQVPLYFLILSALLNVVLDLLFIIVFHWGAAGAAYATVISQGVSGVLCLVYIAKKMPELRLQKEDFRLSAHIVKMQVGIGIPMALQFSITAIGTMMVQSALNMLGSMAVAAFTAASKVEQIATQAYVALGTTMATYCAQNMGAGRIDRIRMGFRASTWMGVVYSLVFGLLTAFFGKYLTYLFVSSDVQTLMGQVDIYLKCASLFFIALNIVNVYRNGIQGMGYGILPMMAGVAELFGRGIVALAAGLNRSYLLACLASPVAWVFAGVLLLFMYRLVMKQQEKVFGSSFKKSR